MKTKTVSSSNGGESSSRSAEKRSADEEAADLPTKPTKISKFGFAIGSQTTKKASAISIKLGSSVSCFMSVVIALKDLLHQSALLSMGVYIIK